MRFTGYMICSFFKVHQEALLIYNKRSGNMDKLAVDRSVSATKLSSIEAKSLEHKSFNQDRKNKALMPMLNAPNYAPYEGVNKYKEKDFVSLNELRSCLTKNCMHPSGILLLKHCKTIN